MPETNYIPDPMPDSFETSASAGVASGTAGSITLVKEADGAPAVSNVRTLVFSNGSVTDDGSGQVTISSGGGAGGTLYGSGSPEGAVTGSRGYTYVDTANNAFYVKTSGDSTNTGWTALMT